jgi:hypothetical protein
VNKKREHKPGPGRRRPPADHLVGRTDACRILGVHKRKLQELVDEGVLTRVIDPDRISWFERVALDRLAAAMKKVPQKPHKSRRSTRPEGVERVSGAETRQITEWFIAGLDLAAIAVRSGKRYETIKYLHAQFRRGLPGSVPAGATLDEPAYYPELEPARTAAAAAPTRGLAKARRPTVPAHWFDGAPSEPHPRRAAAAAPGASAPTTTPVPDEWFSGELPALDDEDDRNTRGRTS